MKIRLYFSLIIITLLSVLGTATALSLSVGTGGSAGEAQFSGNYKLDGSTGLSLSAKLDSGSLFKETKAQGSGLNSLYESVSTKENSVQNTVISSGSISTSASSSTSSEGVVVNQNSNLAGDMGFIGIKSISPTNKIIIAGEFDGTGDLSQHISSSSGDIASVGGTVSSAGVDLLNDEISQIVSSGGMDMAAEGLSRSADGAIGKFSLAAVNQAKGASRPIGPSGTPVLPYDLTTISDPNYAGEIMQDSTYLGQTVSYAPLLNGRNLKIDTNYPIQLYLRADKNLANEKLDPQLTGRSIATAAATWDSSTNANLFTGNVIVSSNAAADRGDGYFVHAFKPISGNALAYTRAWTYTGTDTIADADVCYNTLNQWTLNWDNANGPIIDVQSIALHELGHSVGLGDMYWVDANNVVHQTDKYQAMDAYDDRQRYLGAGDQAGLQKIYGV